MSNFLVKVQEASFNLINADNDRLHDVLSHVFIVDKTTTPITYDEQVVQECLRLCEDGLSIDAISQGFGIPPHAFKQFLSAYPDLAVRMRQSYLKTERKIAKTLQMLAMEGNFNAIKYYLESRGTDWGSATEDEVEETPRLEININPPLPT